MGAVTITFLANQDIRTWYRVNGVTASGGRIPIASGWASNSLKVTVSGYGNYTFSAAPSGIYPSGEIYSDTSVSLVYATPSEFMTILWAIFEYIGAKWGNASNSDMPQFQFERAINWQIDIDPAYAMYYAETVSEYTRLLQQLGTQDAALEALFSENQKTNPKLPNVANYVLKEFMIWQVAFGGFRSFGPPFQNYTGWMGGGSFNDQPPPYRALP